MAQDTLVEIKCRLCLEKGLDMVDILSVERMSEKVHSFLQIEVSIRYEIRLVLGRLPFHSSSHFH